MNKMQMDPLDTNIPTIEWSQMDKFRFIQLTMLNSFTVRGLLYPFTVVKTRLQIQKHKTLYSGTFDCFKKIIRYEGFSGLYKGFWINSIQVVSGATYIMTFEKTKHLLSQYAGIKDNSIRGLIAGACGSLVGQTIITPFDVISQHMMLRGQITKNGLAAVPSTAAVDTINLVNSKNRHGITMSIIKNLYKQDGLRGFYRGYFASCCCYVPHSGLWWMFYPVYSEMIAQKVPSSTSHLLIHAMAGPLSGLTVTLITNPLDIIRAKIQVQRLDSFIGTAKQLFQEEGYNAFSKGLSARLFQSGLSSFIIVIGYESLKRFSLDPSHKHLFRW